MSVVPLHGRPFGASVPLLRACEEERQDAAAIVSDLEWEVPLEGYADDAREARNLARCFLDRHDTDTRGAFDLTWNEDRSGSHESWFVRSGGLQIAGLCLRLEDLR